MTASGEQDRRPGPDLRAEVCAAVAQHLGLAPEDVLPDARVGLDLALDSLDVLTVVTLTGQRTGLRVSLNHSSPETARRLGDLDRLTVEGLADCLTLE